jgi:sugar phosphate isomerase/epimerase
MSNDRINRRQFHLGVAAAAVVGGRNRAWAGDEPFRLNYILGSPMYGTTDLAEVLGEVRKTGAEWIDIWPRRHADHREQVEAMGHERFLELLKQHGVRLGVITRYDLGPYGLQDEMRRVEEARRTRDRHRREKRRGQDAARSGQGVCRQPRAARRRGRTVGRYDRDREPQQLADPHSRFDPLLRRIRRVAAFGHRAGAIPSAAGGRDDRPRDHRLGPALVFFQAWQHGMGSAVKLPKEQELLQMPGRGPLDFTPLLAALKQIGYRGFTEIFMHPVPRGIPILETTEAVTAEINRARDYLERCLSRV